MNSQVYSGRGDIKSASVASIAAMMGEYDSLLPYLTYQERIELDRLLSGVEVPIWEPFEGPQKLALECEADELFYGGAAGGGKSDLLLGAAITRHISSIIFRREYAELEGIRERALELFEGIGKYNGQREVWRFRDGPYAGKRVEFGACQHLGDERKFQGRPHDLKAFDEITQFTEAQFRFLITWNRTIRKDQRCRVIVAGNPPVNAEGRWVIRYWAPWLDPTYPKPARQGELRWFITDQDGNDREVDGPEPITITMADGTEDILEPKSRTFIRARVEDNPRLMETGYRRTLQNLPEPLRSRMLKGDFGVGEEDREWQVIPTDWIVAAQSRWAETFEEYLRKQHQLRWERERDAILARVASNIAAGKSAEEALEDGAIPEFKPLSDEEVAALKAAAIETSAVGIDVSRGGRDSTNISYRVGTWFDRLISIPGKKTQDGASVIQRIIELGLQDKKLQIDVTGVGTAPVDVGKMYGMDVAPMINSGKSYAKDRSGKLSFVNLRAEWWWKFREDLDPSFDSQLALPPDPDLLADLAAPVWSLTPRGILVEPKEHIKSRLKRSPDKGDAIVLAHATPHVVAEGFLQYMRELSEEAKRSDPSFASSELSRQSADDR